MRAYHYVMSNMSHMRTKGVEMNVHLLQRNVLYYASLELSAMELNTKFFKFTRKACIQKSPVLGRFVGLLQFAHLSLLGRAQSWLSGLAC